MVDTKVARLLGFKKKKGPEPKYEIAYIKYHPFEAGIQTANNHEAALRILKSLRANGYSTKVNQKSIIVKGKEYKI